ncbi:MAG: nuclear transport factor 2 family protein [Novosphingobium sp.]
MVQESNLNRELVQDFFAALSAKDVSALARVLHPDVTWTMMASDAANRLRAMGLDEAAALFVSGSEGVFAPGDPKSRITGFVSEGDRAMAETSGSGRRSDGKLYDNLYAWAFEFTEGRIAEIREYTDTAYALRFFDLSAD